VDELQKYENLLNELLSTLQNVMQSGEVLSDELQGQIAEEISFLSNKIDELRNAAVPPLPPLEPAPFGSAVVNSFRYDPKSQNLFVKFQDKFPGTNGPKYVYKGVEPFIFEIFRGGAIVPKTSGKNGWHSWKKGVGPSLGASLNALLKNGGYSFTKIS